MTVRVWLAMPLLLKQIDHPSSARITSRGRSSDTAGSALHVAYEHDAAVSASSREADSGRTRYDDVVAIALNLDSLKNATT